MRYTDGYTIETNDGLFYRRPTDILLNQAVAIVPRINWSTCPECGRQSPLMYGDPDKSYWCIMCQIAREFPEEPDPELMC